MSTPRPDLRLGTDLGPYRLESVIGRGGMGVVYLATDRNLGRHVALKLLPEALAADADFRARFIRESKMAAAIDDPNILPVYDAGEVDGVLFIAMRYVEGSDLEQRLGAGALQPADVIHLLGQVASALDSAHARGLVHRDVKPANILIAGARDDERGEHAYLADFGLTRSRGLDTSLTRAGTLVGTLDYMAPEQLEGRDLDGAADQYALAAIAFRALTGRLAFPRDSEVALISAHLKEPPPSATELRPELPAAVDAVVARGMAKTPADRYPSCAALITDLRSALAEASPALSGLARRHNVDRRVWVALAISGAFAAFALATWLGDMGAGRSPAPSAGGSGAADATLAAASPSQAATSTASATRAAFPDAAEASLLASLPATLRQACERGSYVAVQGDDPTAGVAAPPAQGGAFLSAPTRTPTASLSCPQVAASGANLVLIRDFGEPTNQGKAGFTADGAVSRLAASQGTRGGDCAIETRVNGRWQRAGVDTGAIVCYTDTSSGDAVLAWSYVDEAIMVRAVNEHGDSTALYDFFLQIARYIAP
jgi:serine/threonine protein kinase